MKRYTLTFQSLGSPVPLDDLRKEVDALLLKLHPRITYKMRQVFTNLDGKLLAEIAVEGKINRLNYRKPDAENFS